MTLFTGTRLGLAMSLVPMVISGQSQSGPEAPLAIVDGQAIYELDLLQAAGPRMARLRNQVYQIRSQVLQEAIRQKLLEREARKRGLEPEALLVSAVDSKIVDPTGSEIEAAYEAQKDRIQRPLEEIRAQLERALKRAKIQKARQDFLDSLRGKVEVSVIMRPPTTEVSLDPARVQGDPKAPVTIVEFSDYQCPYCARSQTVLRSVLTKYKGRVRLAFRDFPLRGVHPEAQAAAEASRCAAEQGKFWEYHDALFADRTKLDPAGLSANARELELDMNSFETCLSSRKYKAQVEQDLEEGTKAGVEGTPAFFINGVFLNGAQPASEFEKIIEAELALTGAARRAQ